ncbi:hypothetical protein [Fuscovulum ytuae]|uniref:MarR family transcriptional regulator n=1 Tax=Fuscovulum ytuae TaxID=3042299 RepID=A0ABY8Q442_9RHOB|nr:hypothetical protein [Fuscovulum sp. YMD61]WGV14972.1 hypothetical protein QF092_11815 [Fuscovulum sp. YMD61]
MLRAIECIARIGPLSYDSLKVELGISKTATWRIVQTLRDAGWVRVRRGGKLIELATHLDELFANAHFSDAEFTEVADVLHDLGAEHPVHFDLFTMDAAGQPDLLDTTRRMTTAGLRFDIDEDLLLFTLRAAMTPQQLVRHFTKVLETAQPELAEAIRSGAEGRRLRKAPGALWGETALFISLRGRMGSPAVIRVEPRDGLPLFSTATSAHSAIKTCLAAVVEFRSL